MDEKLVLIADDAAFMRKMIKNALLTAGLTRFIEAKSGQEAVDLYAQQHPDLVMMDVTMPVKDGLEALKEIMAIDPGAKVVMCSAIGQDGTIMEAIRTGASEFIVKPFKTDQIVEAVMGLLL
ncbi:MAG: response regulator [Lachnospiraceae bacterium]|nr:response regulator [Lachnospiraceae bacterium]MDD3795704.1 response regulator [Lachnospiraceae bacterium]